MPVAKLTVLNVRTLKALGGKRTDYHDALLPGFVLRVTPGGARTYALAYWSAGAKRRLTIGDALEVELGKARTRARAALERIEAGLAPKPPAAAPAVAFATLTVGRLVELALDGLDLASKTRKEWERLARVEIIPTIGRVAATELRRVDVREWVKTIRGRSAWTSKHAFEVLRRAYTWGLEEELVEHSPCDRMKLGFKVKASRRVLTAEELWALVLTIRRRRRHPGYLDVVELLLLTMARESAALGIRREELEALASPDKRRWSVPPERMKADEPHLVPLSAAAARLLERRLEISAPLSHLFPIGRHRTGDDVPMTWSSNFVRWLKGRVESAVNAARRRRGLKRAAVPRWTIHNLRHSAATHLREDLHVDRDLVSLLLSHVQAGPGATRVYDRAERLPERRVALEAWARWLEQLRPEGAAPQGNIRVAAFVRRKRRG